jgi:DMSO/TMAO reductase YedYZ molybdopterin-dependent catalytic subunit
MIHGMVDRPLTFTMEDLKRLPSVTRLHSSCAGNEAESEDRSGIARDDQLRRMDWRARAQLKGALKSAMTSP